MSLGIGHFAVGATGAIVLLLATGLYRRTTQNGAIAILSGMWAMLPDLDILLSAFEDADHSPLADLFWFHHTLDGNAFTDGPAGSAAFVAMLFGAVLLLILAEWNENRGASSPPADLTAE